MDPTPNEIYGFQVVQFPNVLRGQLYDGVVGVLHETQNNSWGLPDPSAQAAAEYMRGMGIDATFVVDTDTILQMQPADRRVTTLRNNAGTPSTNGHAVQIEVCWISSQSPHIWDPGTFERTAACVAFLSEFHGIPLKAPYDWPDATTQNLASPWASRNARRVKAEAKPDWFAGEGAGWWQHLEAPWQSPSYHWDCGALRRSVVLARAAALLGDDGEDDMALTKEEHAALMLAADRGKKNQQYQEGLAIGLGLKVREDFAPSYLELPDVKLGIFAGEKLALIKAS